MDWTKGHFDLLMVLDEKSQRQESYYKISCWDILDPHHVPTNQQDSSYSVSLYLRPFGVCDKVIAHDSMLTCSQ